MTDYTIAVLEDAFQLLEILNNNPEGLSLADLTAKTGFVKNKVFRILYTLEKQYVVQRNTSGNYQLGYRWVEFSNNVQANTLLVEASYSVMKSLVNATSESIFLGVIQGTDALCIAAEESPQSIRLFAQVGRRTPLHSGGVPKVLLSYLPENKQKLLIHEYFDGNDVLSNGLSRTELDKQIIEINAQGYAIIIDELDDGAHSIAAPIRNHTGQVIAAISIAGPSNRFTSDCIDHYVDLILEASDEISRRLGYHVTYPNGNGIPHLSP